MDINEVKDCLSYLFEAKITPFIVGHAGIGKTQGVAQYAQENGYNVLVVMAGQMADAGDLVGLPQIIESNGQKTTSFIKPLFLPREGKWILFLDEINRALPDVQQALFQLIYDRKLQDYELPVDTVLVAAGNPDTKDYNVQGFSEVAWNDRFCFLQQDPDHTAFLDYAKEKNLLPSTMMRYISNNKSIMGYNKLEDFALDFVKPTYRSVEFFGRIEKLDPPEKVLLHIGMGLWGLEATVSYLEERKKMKVVTAEDVLFNYDEIQQYLDFSPTNVGELSTLVNDLSQDEMLLKIKDAKTANNLRLFTESLPKDIAFNLVKAIAEHSILSSHSHTFAKCLYDSEKFAEIAALSRASEKRD